MTVRQPYPGLRPFTRHESDIFFGREEQIDDLMRRLANHRFLAVVGESGCGKSSLVRAGLIAALQSGFMTSAGARWHIALMRPGSNPIERLMKALLESGLVPEEEDEATLGFLRSTLNRGPKGLTDALQLNPLPEKTNLLLLVDQFEELFRISREADRDQADAFVAMLLDAVQQSDIPIYVVMTMRSDFLGDTAMFRGLPESVNDGIYLTPRLTRANREASIKGPARVFGGNVEPALVNKLLNEMATDSGRLPLMQHLLMRMWNIATVSVPAGEDEGDGFNLTTSLQKNLTLEQYEATGGLHNALNIHAEEVFGELSEEQQAITKSMFNALCDRSLAGNSLRDTRHPTRIDAIAKIAGVDSAAVIRVADRFRAAECNFVTPNSSEPIYPNSMIDISHESLMHSWTRLSGWMDEESIHNETFDEMLKDAVRWDEERKESPFKAGQHLWDAGARAFRAKDWREKAGSLFEVLRPDDYELVNRFAKASKKRRTTKFIAFATVWTLPILAVAVSSILYLKSEWAGEVEGEVLGLRAAFDAHAMDDDLFASVEALTADFRCNDVTAAIESSNNLDTDDSPITDEESVLDIEATWTDVKAGILNSNCSVELRRLQELSRANSGLIEVFATNQRGMNVCMSQETSDYVQSDEDWWDKGLDTDDAFIGKLDYDDSAKMYGIQVHFPVRNETGDKIGVAKAVFDLVDFSAYKRTCPNN